MPTNPTAPSELFAGDRAVLFAGGSRTVLSVVGLGLPVAHTVAQLAPFFKQFVADNAANITVVDPTNNTVHLEAPGAEFDSLIEQAHQHLNRTGTDMPAPAEIAKTIFNYFPPSTEVPVTAIKDNNPAAEFKHQLGALKNLATIAPQLLEAGDSFRVDLPAGLSYFGSKVEFLQVIDKY